MKNSLWLLFKTNLINTYKLKATSKKKALLTIILIIYIVGTLGVSLSFFLNTVYESLEKVGLTSYYLVVLFAIASLFAFVFSIFSAKSSLFDNKDNDLLLSLPVKRSDILTSRLLMVIGYNFFIGLIFIIPGLIIYLQANTVTTIYLISIVLLTLFFSIIPTILSCLFGYFIAMLTSNSKKKSMMELIYYTAFIFLYMFIMNNSTNILNSLISDINKLNIILKTVFLPIYLILKGLTTNNFLYILGFAGINLTVLVLFVLILNRSYLKILSKLSAEKTSKTKYKMTNTSVTSSSIKKALLKKECKKYFGSAIYVFNTIFGVFLILIAAIGSLIYSKEKILAMANLGDDMSAFSLVLIILIFVLSLSDTTNSCISIERNNFWIMKMIPVTPKEIFGAKLMLNRLVIIPGTIISLIIFTISGYINLGELALMIILAIVYGCFISNFGLIVNLMFPKLDAINDNVIVKQSAASFVGIFGGIIFFIICLIISDIANISNMMILGINIIISIVLYVISTLIINNWGVKKFQKIN